MATDHAQTVREALAMMVGNRRYDCGASCCAGGAEDAAEDAIASLDALVATVERGDELLSMCGRKLEAAEAALVEARQERDALAAALRDNDYWLNALREIGGVLPPFREGLDTRIRLNAAALAAVSPSTQPDVADQ